MKGALTCPHLGNVHKGGLIIDHVVAERDIGMGGNDVVGVPFRMVPDPRSRSGPWTPKSGIGFDLLGSETRPGRGLWSPRNVQAVASGDDSSWE